MILVLQPLKLITIITEAMISELYKAEQAIEQVILRFTEAWNIHDAKAFSSVFAEKADFTNVFGKKAHGRRAIERLHAAIFSTMFRNSKLTAEELSVRFIDENLAAADVRWSMTGATDREGNALPHRQGLMSLVMKKEQSEWSILIMHNMDLEAGLN